MTEKYWWYIKKAWEWWNNSAQRIEPNRWNAFGRSHHKTHKQGKTSKGSQRYYCPICQQSFTETFDTLYYRRQVEPEKIRTLLQSRSEGSSLRGVCRTTNLAYNTVVSLVRGASVKGQIVHNDRVEQVETEKIVGDEFWSFVQKKFFSSIFPSAEYFLNKLAWNDKNSEMII